MIDKFHKSISRAPKITKIIEKVVWLANLFGASWAAISKQLSTESFHILTQAINSIGQIECKSKVRVALTNR